MKTITFNAGDWTGRKITIKVNNKNEFKLFDYSFRAEFREIHMDGKKLYDELLIYRDDEVRPLVKGAKFTDDRTWFVHAFGVCRDHADPLVGAGQVLANII